MKEKFEASETKESLEQAPSFRYSKDFDATIGTQSYYNPKIESSVPLFPCGEYNDKPPIQEVKLSGGKFPFLIKIENPDKKDQEFFEFRRRMVIALDEIKGMIFETEPNDKDDAQKRSDFLHEATDLMGRILEEYYRHLKPNAYFPKANNPYAGIQKDEFKIIRDEVEKRTKKTTT